MTGDEQIQAKQFTYCSAWYPTQLAHRHFVVMTPVRSEAQKRAETFASEMWGKPEHVNVYPRTYILKARKAYAVGMHD